MKIAIESSNCVKQNEAGGIQMRIGNYYACLKKYGVDVILFDKWNHKITDFDILHIFKVNFEDYRLAPILKMTRSFHLSSQFYI